MNNNYNKYGYLVVGVIAVLFILSSGNESEKQTESVAQEQDINTQLYNYCIAAVTLNLNDPKSAEYTGKESARFEQIGNDTWYVTTAIRARNGFNALVLHEFECKIQKNFQDIKLLSVKENK